MRSSTKQVGSRPGSGVRGFTIVEAMVGMVLLSLMVLGFNNLWVVVDDYFFKLQIRQKAVLRLNGEMERLAVFARGTSLLVTPGTFADAQTTIGRWIYRADPVDLTLTGSVVVETGALNTVTSLTYTEDQILFFDDVGTNAASDLNVVWLDKDSNVTGRFEWEIVEQNANCFRPCYVVEGRLGYPYRHTDNLSPTRTSMGTISTIAIRTVLTQRRRSP